MALLESYRYRLHVRRFIVELFDKSVVEQLVRGGARGEGEDEDASAAVGQAS